MTYSGYLESGDGVPLDGKHSVAVHFYGAVDADGSDDLCSANNAADTGLVAGRFQIALPAKCTDAIKASPDVWVEVEVDGGPLGRTKLGAVPYAIEASHATTADSAALANEATNAPTVTDWTAFVPKWTIGTVAQPGVASTGFYRRVGDSVQLQVRINSLTAVTNATGALSVALPDGLVADTAKMVKYVDIGVGHIAVPTGAGATTGTLWNLHVIWSNKAVQFQYTGPQGDQWVTDSTPFSLKTGLDIVASYSVPIVGWTATSR